MAAHGIKGQEEALARSSQNVYVLGEMPAWHGTKRPSREILCLRTPFLLPALPRVEAGVERAVLFVSATSCNSLWRI